MRARTAIAASVLVALLLAAATLAPRSRADEPAIDWQRASLLLARERRGEALSPDERAYLDRAKQERQRLAGRGPTTRPQMGGPLTPKESTGLVPLDELAGEQSYKGEDGGLYGGGQNVPPKTHAEAAAKELARIAPLDAAGQPAAAGQIVLVAIGMSNTTQEFSRFKEQADRDPAKRPEVVIVDAAQGGQAAREWDEAAGPRAKMVWAELDRRLAAARVTPRQVQAVWIKQALIGPAQYGQFPAHARRQRDHTVAIIQTARARFPSLRVAYLSSRTYGGYATGGLNPEPYAYEGAFAVRWIILEQIKGEPALNWNPARGEVKAPVVLWGPYLWADGVKPRKSDGLSYQRQDFAGDGVHPSVGPGRAKVAGVILRFFTTDPLARGWFVRAGAAATRPE